MSAHVFNSAGTALVAARVYVFERDKMIARSSRPDAERESDYLRRQLSIWVSARRSRQLDSSACGRGGVCSRAASYNADAHGFDQSRSDMGSCPDHHADGIDYYKYDIHHCLLRQFAAAPVFRNPVRLVLPVSITSRAISCIGWPIATMARKPRLKSHYVANIPVRGSTTNTTHDAIRWYEFRNSGNSTATPTIFQQSTYDPDTNYRWLGSIAMDKDGNMAMGYQQVEFNHFSVHLHDWPSERPIPSIRWALKRSCRLVRFPGINGGNRWGDYSSMTLDPVDQCTFYYTNEYLKTTGSFNWSTRVASYRFPSCTDAPAWGTVTGTVTSCETGAPVSGVTVSLDNGYAAATDASGVYSILVPAGSYTAPPLIPTETVRAQRRPQFWSIPPAAEPSRRTFALAAAPSSMRAPSRLMTPAPAAMATAS